MKGVQKNDRIVKLLILRWLLGNLPPFRNSLFSEKNSMVENVTVGSARMTLVLINIRTYSI